MLRNVLTSMIEKTQENFVDEQRNYIGASSIGSQCLRQIWYEFKGVKSMGVPAKTRRTWAIGSQLESLVIDWLRLAGFKVYLNPQTYFSKESPHFQGHFDGIL